MKRRPSAGRDRGRGPAKSLPKRQLSLVVIVVELVAVFLVVLVIVLLVLVVLLILVILLVLVIVIVKLIVVFLVILIVIHFSHPAFVLYCLRKGQILCKRWKKAMDLPKEFWKK